MASGKRTSDAGLVRACRRQDPAAWERLIHRYRRLVYSVPVAYRLTGDSADEIFQRVAVKLFEHLPTIRNTDSLTGWLLVTARRECQAFLRKEARWTELDERRAEEVDPDDVDGRLHRVVSEHTLALALEQLDRGCRELLEALYLEDPAPSYQELSERLNRPVGSLGPTRSRCLEKLRKLYVKAGGEWP